MNTFDEDEDFGPDMAPPKPAGPAGPPKPAAPAGPATFDPPDRPPPAVIEWNGRSLGTGLLLPPQNLMSAFPQAETAVRRLTRQERAELFTDPARQAGRKRFGPDWIRNQGSKSSCNGFAAAWALARARVNGGQQRQNLSGAGLYSLINGNRDAGSMLDDGMLAMQQTGVPPEEFAGPDQIFRNQIRPEAWPAAGRFRALECVQTRDQELFFSGLALGWVGVVAVHAGPNFNRLDARGVAGADSGPGNHAVGVDDGAIVNGDEVADCFNSWSVDWGADGRCYLSWRRHLAATTVYHAFYLIRDAGDDSQSSGDDPPAAR